MMADWWLGLALLFVLVFLHVVLYLWDQRCRARERKALEQILRILKEHGWERTQP
jgi:hypothetical protein